jgi:hypothetical protein
MCLCALDLCFVAIHYVGIFSITGGLRLVCLEGERRKDSQNKALFSSEKISDFSTVAFSFLFDKQYPIVD